MSNAEKKQRQTVVYLRTKSTQPSPLEPDALPRRGAPIGAIAYTYSDRVLEVAFSLQHSKQDRWNSTLCHQIVLNRLERKRETCERQRKTSFGVEFYDADPKYFRLELSPPEGGFRPYDVLFAIKEASDQGQIRVPERLIRTINQMIADNELRTRRLSSLAEKKDKKQLSSNSSNG